MGHFKVKGLVKSVLTASVVTYYFSLPTHACELHNDDQVHQEAQTSKHPVLKMSESDSGESTIRPEELLRNFDPIPEH